MLQKGQKAPDFTAMSLSQKEIRLSDLKGKMVLMKFHRFSGCPVCRNQFHEFIESSSTLQKAGLETILIMHSSRNKILPNFKENAGISIIPDKRKVLYKLFHSRFKFNKFFSSNSWKATLSAVSRGYFPQFHRMEGGVIGVPSDFLISENGTLTEVHYGNHFGDSWNLETVLKYAKSKPKTDFKSHK